MSIRNLEYLFNPSSVALIGASDRPRSVGAVVMRNLLSGGFAGPILPVNPKHRAVMGVMAYPDVAGLPVVPDLAVICTPAPTLPQLIHDLGHRGCKAAIILTAGLELEKDPAGRTLQEAVLNEARPHLLRILGHNCVGLLVPGIGLNASFAHASASAGGIAFVTQSGALSTAVLDYARSNEIGLSCFASVGNKIDVDFSDVLDYLANDPKTTAILLYIESIMGARKFMSAARAAAMHKPLVAVKAGRCAAGAKAALSHTGAMAGSDDVFDAALRRAGILRVDTIEDLFDAVETLALARPMQGDRLAILTNGGGPGVMATDALELSGGKLAGLSEGTIAALDRVLPSNWSHGNPVDIIGDAPPERYARAMQVLLDSSDCDAILFIQAPTAIVPSDEVAKALAPVIGNGKRTVLSCWVGRDAVVKARRIFNDAAIPTYDTPEDAVRAFLQVTRHTEAEKLRLQAPGTSAEAESKPDTEAARRVIEAALSSGRTLLNEPEAKAVLAAFGIPVVETRVAADPVEAERLAAKIGFPVALKILSPDITHKSDVGGVVLNLETGRDVRAAAEAMRRRVSQRCPEAKLDGFTVQSMVQRPNAWELIAGISSDPIFGPVILFGHGGTAVEVIRDRALGLPPLNEALARELIGRTRIAKLLAGYRGRPPAAMDAVCTTLLRISQLAAELPEVVELDINPLLCDEHGVLALDARMRIDRPARSGTARFAIRPYPRQLEESIDLAGRRVGLRPARPEDRAAIGQFLGLGPSVQPAPLVIEMTGELRPMSTLPAQIDYDRQMVFLAIDAERIIGAVRAVSDPDNVQAACSAAVSSGARRQGLTPLLILKITEYCKARGTQVLRGYIGSDNSEMLGLVRELGWQTRPAAEPAQTEAQLVLQPARQA